jgi:hypothetical protein
MEGYVASIITLHEGHQPWQVAEHLASEVRRLTGARTRIDTRERWASKPGDVWWIRTWDRYLSVEMPIYPETSAAWDVHAGLNMADDFMFRWLSRAEPR